jgi:hypothetical protein
MAGGRRSKTLLPTHLIGNLQRRGRWEENQRQCNRLAPKLVELTDKVLFGDIWERPGLSKRDRSLVTVAALIAMNRTEGWPAR